MSEGQFIADTLESLLAGMAESLREAQEELNTLAPLDGYGRPMPQYRIPHLDFEIGIELKSESTPAGGVRFKFLPLKQEQSSREVASRISGRFIAVPPGEGMPVPRLEAEVESEGAKRTLILQASTSAGQLLQGAEIELNLDREASIGLSSAAGVAAPRLSAVQLTRAMLQTDESGEARTEVTLGTALQTKAVIVLVAELGNERLRVVIGKEIA